MRYPVLVQKKDQNTVIVVCPVFYGCKGNQFFSKGRTLEEALKNLGTKFICYVHDPNIQLQIIPVGYNYENRQLLPNCK